MIHFPPPHVEVEVVRVAEMVRGVLLFPLLHIEVGLVEAAEMIQGLLLFPLRPVEVGLVEAAEMIRLLPLPFLRVDFGLIKMTLVFAWLVEATGMVRGALPSQLPHVEVGLVEVAEMVRLLPFPLLRVEIGLVKVAMVFA